MSKEKRHTANRVFEDYTTLRSLTRAEAGIVLASVVEAAGSRGKAEADDAREFMKQLIVVGDRVLIPEALLERHAQHLGFRRVHQAALFTAANLRALEVMNSPKRSVVTGPEALRLVTQEALSWCQPSAEGTDDASV